MWPSKIVFVTLLAAMVLPPPVTLQKGSDGRVRVSLAAGAAGYESKHFDCNGRLLDAHPVDMRAGGMRVDFLSDSTQLRLTGFAGKIGIDTRDSEAEDYGGAFGGAQLAREGRRVGIGAGIAHVSGHDGFNAPSLHLRLGPLDQTHLQLDFLPPEENFGMSGWARVGVGFHQDDSGRFAGLIGVSGGPYTYNHRFEPRLFGRFRVPVSTSTDVLLGALVGAGARRTQWASSAGVSFHR